MNKDAMIAAIRAVLNYYMDPSDYEELPAEIFEAVADVANQENIIRTQLISSNEHKHILACMQPPGDPLAPHLPTEDQLVELRDQMKARMGPLG